MIGGCVTWNWIFFGVTTDGCSEATSVQPPNTFSVLFLSFSKPARFFISHKQFQLNFEKNNDFRLHLAGTRPASTHKAEKYFYPSTWEGSFFVYSWTSIESTRKENPTRIKLHSWWIQSMLLCYWLHNLTKCLLWFIRKHEKLLFLRLVGSWARECRWPAVHRENSEKTLDSSLAKMLSDNFMKTAGLRAGLRSQSPHFCYFSREVFGETATSEWCQKEWISGKQNMSEVKFIVCNYFCLLATVRRRHHSTINHVPCSANIRKYLNVPIEHFFALCQLFHSRRRGFFLFTTSSIWLCQRLYQLPLPLLKLVSGRFATCLHLLLSP